MTNALTTVVQPQKIINYRLCGGALGVYNASAFVVFTFYNKKKHLWFYGVCDRVLYLIFVNC